jgi:cytochrome c oxidase subunit 2
VRRRLVVCALLASGALAYAGAAAADNGGIAPVGPVSPNGQRIEDAYWLIFAIAATIFVLVEGTLIAFVIRFRRRSRPRTAEGAQIHGSTKLEVGWTVAPVVLLAAIVSFVFYKLPGIKDAPAASGNEMHVRVIGHQFYWRFVYPNGRESINVLRVPVNQVVTLDVETADVIHSWWVPAFGGKTDAMPGKVNHTWFQANKVGVYAIRCAEFCGIQHAAMKGYVQVTGGPTEPALVGKQAVRGVCAPCHGFRLEGMIGPAIATNATLNDPAALRHIIRNGQGKMPAVGKDWSPQLVAATVGYLRSKYGSANSGG